MRRLSASVMLLVAVGCVSGSKLRAESEVLQADIARARREGALHCAPVELATAEAHLDFALGELLQGNSTRASDHVRTAETAVKAALDITGKSPEQCAPKQVLVKEPVAEQGTPAKEPLKEPAKEPVTVVEPEQRPPPLVVTIEEKDSDGDGLPDKDDPCPVQAEDRDGFEDADGCPDPDNDEDGVLDGNDKCPLTPGVPSNQGCPEEAPKDRDGDGVVDAEDPCADQAEDKDGFEDADGCPDLDNDKDGVLDAADKCPDQEGPLQNLGCPVTDKDGDGLPNEQDKCPEEPEDKDGFQDEDGCPDLDNDADGVLDAQDRCPNKPGQLVNAGCPDTDSDGDGVMDRFDPCPEQVGPRENNGCPDPDRDSDGLVDRLDPCPDKPGPRENNGCPDPDKDADGIVDRLDPCPEQAGPRENNGCPEPDLDKDGIADRVDRCPDEPGIKEERGCPKKYKLVVVKRDQISIKKQIRFATRSAKILGRESFAILDDVAQVLKDMPFLKKLRVEGHTDSQGNDEFNQTLSEKRAQAVKAELIKRGIDPGRLEAVGFGESRPIGNNKTAKGRAANRRTEFNIIEQ